MFAIKAEVIDTRAKTFAFREQKTMYGGKYISSGDSILSSQAKTKAVRG